MQNNPFRNKVNYMDITFCGGKAEGSVTPPASKSFTHRAIIMSALSKGNCTVREPLLSFDTRSTMEAVRSMGADVKETENGIEISCTDFHAPSKTIDVGNSGTTLRLMTGISALFDSETTLTGDESIQKRPMGPLLDALSGCKVECKSNSGKPPVAVRGPIQGNEISIDGSSSSQFISSVIMAAPLVGRPMDIVLTKDPVSKPYIRITTLMMEKFGVKVEETKNGYHIEPQDYKSTDYTVPADFSSAAFPLVAGALGGKVTVNNMDPECGQGDSKIIDILRDAGCKIEQEGNSITCYRNTELKALEIDMSDIPDLFPIVSVLMSTAKGTSRLYGAPHLRFKESDRIQLTENMLRTLGADITGTDDGCIINGVEKLRGGRIEHAGDHRMMMSAAIASLISDGPVTMENDECWNVSYPGFPEQMRSLGMRWQ